MSLQQPDHHVPPGPMLLPMTQLTVGQVGIVGGGVRTEQHGNQIVHVRGDSDSDLEALFSVLRNIDGRPPASSFKNRKLPASFFRPPDHPKAVSGGPASTGAATGGQSVHGRSVSSPAQLHHGSGNGTGKSSGPAVTVAGTDNFINEMTPTGGGTNNWDAAKNCQRYYLTATGGIWQSDVPSQHGSMPAHPAVVYQGRGGTGGSGTGQTGGNMQTHQHPVATSPSADFSHPDPLPHGWEQGITAEGEIYYINHVDKTTSWFDPRIPRHRQATTPLRIGSHTMAPHPHPHAQHQQQPQQSPQQHSHLSPKHQQQPQCHQMVAHQQMLSNGQHPPIGNVRPAHNEHFICLELQKLHKEKERLLQEQEAINCREMMLNELVRQTTTTSPCGGNGGGVTEGQMKCSAGVVSQQQQQQQQPEGALAMLHTMQSLYGAAMNPAVDSYGSSCGGSVMESHARQNSTDSGLGGMGTTYSLPRSPDDYLSNVDEMDMQEDVGHTQKSINNSCYLQMAGGGASGDLLHGHMHLTSVGDMIDNVGVMDGDQLFSSLAGDVTSDLLSDMDVQKIDNILYL